MRYYFAICLSFLSLTTHAQITHVEPPNWWVGMKNPNVQLLIHGKQVGDMIPVIQYPGVTIRKANKAESVNYLFLDLEIAADTRPGTFEIQFRKGNKVAYKLPYTLQPRAQDGSQLTGFNSKDVIYLLVPDRFANGDPANDVIAGTRQPSIDRSSDASRHGGDLRGIINSLDYIADMGFTALWPTPLMENDMPAYSYHGYAITNHYKVDPRFGTMEDYKELATKARQRGIKLIYDEVLNHIGTGYWWMNDLPFKDWINQHESYMPTNHRRTVHSDPYAAEYDRVRMTQGWFDKHMADMNGHNPFVATYLTQHTLWMIETLQLGGIREDTYGYSDKDFLRQWTCAVMQEYPNMNIVGEEWSLNPLITSYWQQGKDRRDGYESCLKSVMDFPLQEAVVRALKEDPDPNFARGMTKIYEAMANDFVYADPRNIMVMADNHDMDRIHMQLGQDVALTKMALTFLLTIRGIPQVFYGTEVLMDNTPHHKNDGLIRSDFPGGWKGDAVNALTGTGLTSTQADMQQYMKTLLNWRKSNPVIATGSTKHFAPFGETYVYFRYNDKQKVMVVMNRNATPVTVDLSRFSEILNKDATLRNVITGELIPTKDGLVVPGKTAWVCEVSEVGK
ncbi:MAG: glycoside hydrolase family 13 protein [Cyclobacteriaceae bacterium]|nr:glycoside hydrolase family 13 protein [Cyclobacteriaceae bacterium]